MALKEIVTITEGTEEKSWNMEFSERIWAIDYNHLRFSFPMDWKQEEMGVEQPFAQLNAKLHAIERAINNWWQSDKDYKKKKQEEMSDDNEKEEEDDDSIDKDPIYLINQVCRIEKISKRY